MKNLLLFILSFQISRLFACDGFLPPNDLHISPLDKNEGLTELQYNEAIDRTEKIYAGIVKSHGSTLKIERLWESGTVNAGTYKDYKKNNWIINLYGGLARHQFMTKDAYTIVICHEIGHHIGGAPKKIINQKIHWSSTEGQADYWATLKCMRRIFKDDDNISVISDLIVPSIVSNECEKSFNSKKEYSLCIRLALAGHALSKISSTIRLTPFPEFETPDLTIVAQVFDKHPVPQCRLDSYFQGALCPLGQKENVSQVDDRKGTCHEQNGFQTGRRPPCWYHYLP